MEPNKAPTKRNLIPLPKTAKQTILLPNNYVKQPILLPNDQVEQPTIKEIEDVNLPRIGQSAIKWVGSDQYAATISQIGPEKGIIYLTQYSPSGIRAKKNMKGNGYGEQTLDKATGKWKYEHSSKYRGLSTWYPVEGQAETILSRNF